MSPQIKRLKKKTDQSHRQPVSDSFKKKNTSSDDVFKSERFKQTLQWLMEDRQISEAELSRQANLAPATIHRLIYGITDPRLTTLRAIASFFKIKIEQLIGDYPIPSVTQIDKSTDKILFSTPLLVPFIEWDVLVNHADNINEFTMSNWSRWHVTTNDLQDKTSSDLFADLFATKLLYTAGELLQAESILVIKSLNEEPAKMGDCIIGSNKNNNFVGQISGSGNEIIIKGGASIQLKKCKLYGTIVKCEIPCSKISRYTPFIN